MGPTIMLLVQAAIVDVPAGPPETIDLLAAIRPLRCPEDMPDDIVVCARRPDENRLFLRAPDERLRLPQAEMRLFGGKAAVETETATIPPGMQSNRLMFRFKMPF